MSVASSGDDLHANVNDRLFLDAEQFAESRLGSLPITEEDVIHLITLLPSEECPRSGSNPCGFSFSTGLYVHGGIVGLRSHAKQFPKASCVLAKFAA